MTGMQIVIGTAPGRTTFARLQGGVLTDLEFQNHPGSSHEEQTSRGDVAAARVLRVLKDARGLIVDLGKGLTGFVPWTEGRPLWTASSKMPVTIAHEGLAILAQVKRLGVGEKGPRLSAEISLPGRWSVFIPGGPDAPGGVRASGKMPQDEKTALKTALEPVLEASETLILRTAAAGGNTERITEELTAARVAWQTIREAASREEPPIMLWRDADGLERVLRDWSPAGPVSVLYDVPHLKSEITALAERFGINAELESSDDALGASGVRDALDLLTARRVPLKGRGEIVIDATEALTAIDVNGGGEDGVVKGEAACLEVNLAAAMEIVRQVRLRDIGGLIVIDFLPLRNPQSRKRLMGILQGAFRADEADVRLGTYSEFGTLEVTRQRSGAGLLDRLQETCSRCDGTGRVTSLEESALAMLAGMHAQAQGKPALTMALGPDLFGWVTARREAVEAELARFGHGFVTWKKDEALGARGWRLDQ